MRTWDDRNSFVRRTARKVRDFDVPEKCRQGVDMASSAGRQLGEKVSFVAKDVAEKVGGFDIKGKCDGVKNSVKNGVNKLSGKFGEKRSACPFMRAKESVCGFFSSFVKKVKEKNPFAVAVCVGAAVFALFGIFYSIFYTIFSIGKRRR